ncbi:dihydrolipoyl dehydrogenase family protein [Desulfolutivibrio sulfoxidireducens]|uniref:dihydrolipoyl dehydrogenase family protein n=1 Tax=Desulfolutivibrio sulfoxidireducens TaxID=2773299 RepID=UPI00159E00D2|nr:FAD-dependent oxidoreductase [Desulfolutivibrio sulfoxidireducens]QLA15865.1 FAD-dependent oxidoreductase [Desulfolutivibrio sulfoxidireducens]QLA20233.1 FAD-dependent oxidoreductase [Desulfolutivibrio sulfoxidireducens]
MTSAEPADLFVVGGGPAGTEAALAGAGLGLETVLVEGDQLGGTCLNRGCIPTKLFLGATQAKDELAAQVRLKLAEGTIHVSLSALQTRKERLVSGIRAALSASLAKAGVRVVAGRLAAISPGQARVETPDGPLDVPFKKCILATGSRPAVYPAMAPDNRAILDSTGVLALAEVPESLIIVGAGAIGLEFADIFHRLGSRIILLEGADRIAPAEEPDVGRVLSQALTRKGCVVRAGVRVKSLRTVDDHAVLTLDTGEDIHAAKALVAVGRFPNSDIPGLGECGVRFLGHSQNRAWIDVSEHLLAAPDIYAVGDVNGRTLLAHAASHQALYAARHAAGKTDAPYDPGAVPGCIYGSPETLRVGRMPRELTAQGLSPEISEAQLAANPMAQAHAASLGFVRVVWLEGRVAGVTAVGHGVAAMGTLATVIVNQAWTREDAEKTIFPHPGLDESLRAALLAGKRKS